MNYPFAVGVGYGGAYFVEDIDEPTEVPPVFCWPPPAVFYGSMYCFYGLCELSASDFLHCEVQATVFKATHFMYRDYVWMLKLCTYLPLFDKPGY